MSQAERKKQQARERGAPMTPAERQKNISPVSVANAMHPEPAISDRKRRHRQRQRDGIVRLVIEVDRLWWAEALARGRYIANPDEDDRAELEAGTQRLADDLIEIAKAEGDVSLGEILTSGIVASEEEDQCDDADD